MRSDSPYKRKFYRQIRNIEKEKRQTTSTYNWATIVIAVFGVIATYLNIPFRGTNLLTYFAGQTPTIVTSTNTSITRQETPNLGIIPISGLDSESTFFPQKVQGPYIYPTYTHYPTYTPYPVQTPIIIQVVIQAEEISKVLTTKTPALSTPSPDEVGPTLKIVSVLDDQSVTIHAKKFPPNDTVNITMGNIYTQGRSRIQVAAQSTGPTGEFTGTFNIPSTLKGQPQIEIGLESVISGYFVFNWFYNGSSGNIPPTGATQPPPTIPNTGPTATLNSIPNTEPTTVPPVFPTFQPSQTPSATPEVIVSTGPDSLSGSGNPILFVIGIIAITVSITMFILGRFLLDRRFS